MAPETRKRDPSELFGEMQRALLMLVEGITRMDDGDPRGVDLVAQSERKLAGSNKGDRLLIRVPNALEMTSMPELPALTPEVRAGDPTLVFAFGSFPFDADRSDDDPPRPESLQQLLSAKCVLLSDEKEQVCYTWSDLFMVVADKLAVHTDDEIPLYVEQLCGYQIGGVPVLRYALRTIGVVLASYGHEILTGAGVEPLEAPALLPPGVPWIGAALVYQFQGKLDVQVHARLQPGSDLLGWTNPGRVEWLHNPPQLPGLEIERWPLDARPGRNDRCPCGSGTKFKRCHGASFR